MIKWADGSVPTWVDGTSVSRRLINDFNMIGRNAEVDDRDRFVHGDLEGRPSVTSKRYRNIVMKQGEGPRRQ